MFGKKDDSKPAPSGAEMMMRSLGMGPVLDMAIGLANDGTLAKIIEFADKADDIILTLRRIENAMAVQAYRESNGLPIDGEPAAGTAGIEPGSDSGVDGDARGIHFTAHRLVDGVSANGSSTGHDNGSGPANGGAAPVAVDGDNPAAV